MLETVPSCRNLQIPKYPAHVIQSKDNRILKSLDLIKFLTVFIVNKLDKKKHCSLWNMKVYYSTYKSQPLDRILNQTNPLDSVP